MTPSHHEGRRPRHESKDVNLRGVLPAAGILAATVALGFVAAWWVFDYLNERGKQSRAPTFPLAAQEGGRLPAEPRLEEIDRLAGNTSELAAAQQRVLETYGWVDEKAGVVRIPISRAMRIIVDNKRLPAHSDDGTKQVGARRRPSAANSGRGYWREQ